MRETLSVKQLNNDMYRACLESWNRNGRFCFLCQPKNEEHDLTRMLLWDSRGVGGEEAALLRLKFTVHAQQLTIGHFHVSFVYTSTPCCIIKNLEPGGDERRKPEVSNLIRLEQLGAILKIQKLMN